MKRIKGRKSADKMYMHGIQIAVPFGEANEVSLFRYTGCFDHRALRRMLRKSLNQDIKFTTDEIDWIIKTYGVKLRPANMEEMLAMATDDEEDASPHTDDALLSAVSPSNATH